MSDTDFDDDGHTCGGGLIAEPLDLHDFVGIALGLVAAISGNVSSFFGMCAQEFHSSAKYRRQERQMAKYEAHEEAERARMAALTLEGLAITSEEDPR